MNLRDALAWAIDFIRAGSDDPDAGKCTKALEASLSRLRARDRKGISMIPDRCYCGEVRAQKALVCPACYRLVPMDEFLALHFGKPKARKRAVQRIKVMCQTRAAQEQHLEEAA